MTASRIAALLFLPVFLTGPAVSAQTHADQQEKPEGMVSGTGPRAAATADPAPEAGSGPREFSRQLGRNFIGLFSQENLVPLLVGAGATGIGLALDDPVNDWFRRGESEIQGREKSRLGNFVEFGEILGTQLVVGAGVGGLVLADHFSDSPRFHDYASASAQGFVLNSLLTLTLKHSLRRERPDASNRRSFPSGHTSNMFTMATITHHYYGPRYGIPAFLVAGLVGMSRLDEGVHYLGDVAAGATLGYIVGRTVAKGTSPARRIDYLPLVSSREKVYGAALSVRF